MIAFVHRFIHHDNLTRQEDDVCRYFALGLLIALPLAAEDETRIFRCPKGVSVKIQWPQTIPADGPDGPVTLKLLDGPREIAADTDSGPILWFPGGGITCVYPPWFDLEARYGDGGNVKTCSQTSVRFAWPRSVGSNPRYELNQAAPDPSGPIPLAARDPRSNICTYRQKPGGYPAFYVYPISSEDKKRCVENYRDDTVICTIKK